MSSIIKAMLKYSNVSTSKDRYPSFGHAVGPMSVCCSPIEAMKVSAHINGHWIAVPCLGTESVAWLGEEVLRRYSKMTSHAPVDDITDVRLTRGGALLDADDTLGTVLDDNDVISVCELHSNIAGTVVTHFEPL